MSEKPIIFSSDMVRAILASTKTQTRRVIKPQPDDDGIVEVGQIGNTRGIAYIRGSRGGQSLRVPCPYGSIGDHLWVRETWASNGSNVMGERLAIYRASHEPGTNIMGERLPDPRWHPSIHMPRWASRITLEITDVRVERLQEINYDDCISEGIKQEYTCINPGTATYAHANDVHDDFRKSWDSLNAKRGFGWDTNPYVWVISFRRLP